MCSATCASNFFYFDSYLRDSVRARGHFRAKGDARSMNLSQSDHGIRLGGRYRPTNSDADNKCGLLRQSNEVLCIRTSGIIRPRLASAGAGIEASPFLSICSHVMSRRGLSAQLWSTCRVLNGLNVNFTLISSPGLFLSQDPASIHTHHPLHKI